MLTKKSVSLVVIASIVTVIMTQTVTNVATLAVLNNNKTESPCFDTMVRAKNDINTCYPGQKLTFIRDIDGSRLIVCSCNNDENPVGVIPDINIKIEQQTEQFEDDIDTDIDGVFN